MKNELQKQVEGMFTTIYDACDLKYIRPFKRSAMKCAIDCLDDKFDSRQSDECSDQCGLVLKRAFNIAQKEVNNFQGRIDRCLMDCQDGVRNEQDHKKAEQKFEACAEQCVIKFAKSVPDVVKNICQELDKLKKTESVN